MIQNDKELKVTLARISRFYEKIARLRATESNPDNYRTAVSGFLAEVERMQLEVREYLMQPKTPSRRSSARRGSAAAPPYRNRHIEQRWKETHGDVLRQYAGQWVVLELEEIVSHGDDASQVVQEARDKGVEVPYIFRVAPIYDEDVAHFGL